MARSEWDIVQDMTNGVFTADEQFARYYTASQGWYKIIVLSQSSTQVKYRYENDETQMETVRTVSVEEFKQVLAQGHFKPGNANSYKSENMQLAKRDARYARNWGKDANIKNWTDVYHLFDQIIEKYRPDWQKIAAEVKKLYEPHRGDGLWDEAYRRWLGN